jgi:mono/diheme cytochrome c family protein
LLQERKYVWEHKLLMGKSIFGVFGVALLILQNSESAWAQNQAEGKKLYATYCSTCHGDKGKGDGMAARSLPVKPADHTNGAVMNQFSDKFLMDIISQGGGAVGKSAMMPGWGSQLGDKEIRDLMAYVRSLAEPPDKAPGK